MARRCGAGNCEIRDTATGRHDAPAGKAMADKINITEEDLKKVMWSLALSDHMGDALEAASPIFEAFGIKYWDFCDQNELLTLLQERELQPEHAKR